MTAPTQAPGAPSGTFLALRNRNFRLYFRGQLVSNTGNWLTNVALTLLVLDITGSGFAVGLLAAFQYGPILLLSAWAGAIADRLDKRRLLMLTQSLEMAQSFALAAVAFLPDPPLAALYGLAALGGTLLAFDNPLRRSFVSEMVPPEDIPNAVVLYSTIVNVSRIFGPALAGLLVVTLDYGWAFAIDGASYVTVLVSLAMMRAHELYREPPKARTKGEVRAGLRYVRSLPHLWISFAMLGAIGAISYNFGVTLPLFVTDALHGSEGAFTILYSVFSLGAVVSALIVARRRLVGIQHIVAGAAALGVAMLLLSLVPGVLAAGPAVFLVGMASILYMTATTSILQVEAKHEMHGRVLALQTVVLIGTAPLGGPILGWLADALGARWPLVLGGVVSLAAAAFGAWATRRFTDDRERAHDSDRDHEPEAPAHSPAEPVRTLGRDDDEIGV
jgi:MFS family permease